MVRESLVDVLIVGAGPTGLTLANDLALRGITFKIIDKAPEPTRVSKAIVVHARNLELFENLGLVDAFLENGLAVRGMNVFSGDKRIVHLNMDELDSHYKYTLAISQAKTEELLTRALEARGVLVERSHELKSYEQDDQEVRALVKSPALAGSDSPVEDEIVRAKFLVGCDGAHSVVRHQAGFEFEGAAYQEIFGAADVRLDVAPGGHFADDEGYAFLGEHGVIVFIPFGGNRYRIIFGMAPDAGIDPESTLTFDFVEKITKERAPAHYKISEPHWLSWFRIHRRCASSYRQGRVFIAGDAAHIHSPVGGVGMNTGMQDAANLSWKLALAVKGQGDILNSYQEERRPVGQAVLMGTDMATRVVTLRNPLAKNLRNMLMGLLSAQELVQQRVLKAGSLTGISYRASTLSTESHPPVDQAMTFSRNFRFGGSDVDGERPGLAAWMDFARGPVAGDRMHDGEVQNGQGENSRLAHLIASPNFKLLIFDGYAATEAGYDKIAAIEKEVSTRYGESVDIHVIVPFAKGRRTLPPYSSVIFDYERQLHKTYGASSECLYLVRPDGYIGFRSQPAQFDELDKYLQSIYKLRASV